jgi:hypothetical protein
MREVITTLIPAIKIISSTEAIEHETLFLDREGHPYEVSRKGMGTVRAIRKCGHTGIPPVINTGGSLSTIVNAKDAPCARPQVSS